MTAGGLEGRGSRSLLVTVMCVHLWMNSNEKKGICVHALLVFSVGRSLLPGFLRFAFKVVVNLPRRGQGRNGLSCPFFDPFLKVSRGSLEGVLFPIRVFSHV